ncbi:MAG: hypothetical protein SNI70_09780 [Rikenellaceae bacterium]
MEKFWAWINTSNRLQHLGVGFAIGITTGHIDAAVVAGAAAEYKDWCYASKPGGTWGWLQQGSFDWIDVGMTTAGGVIGAGIHHGIAYLIGR